MKAVTKLLALLLLINFFSSIAHSEAPTFSDPSMLKRAFRAWPESHSIKLKCEATGAPPLKYTWIKDGKKMHSRRMDPYLNTTIWYLKLKDLVPDDSGKYTCIVSNPYGSINHTYTLQVVAKPRSKPMLEKSLPKNTTVKLGDTATMTCTVVVSGTLPDFRWLKWDKSVTSIQKIGDLLEYGPYRLIKPQYYNIIRVKQNYGVQLTITNVTEQDFGLYTCLVSNRMGKDYNSAFLSKYVKPTVPVKEAPTFSNPKMLKRSFRAWPASNSIKLKCRATGAPPLKYTWLKNGRNIPRRRVDPRLNTTVWYLKLKNLVPNDSGKYTCIVSNPYGSINHTYTLHVVAKSRSRPILDKSHPKNTTVQLGGNATMTCIVLVSGALPDYRWLKWDKSVTSMLEVGDNLENGSYHLIKPQYYKTIRVKDNYGVELTITNVTEDDFGLYTCLVSNYLGKDYKSAFLSKYVKPRVPIKEAPTFSDPNTIKRTFTAWPASHSIKLKCEATGAPPLKYTWIKDGEEMHSRRMDPYLNTTIWYLKLKYLVPDDSGKYTCIVSNPYGSINHTYTLQVVAKPRSRPFLDKSLPKNTAVQLGDNAIMTCTVVSGTLPDFRWLKWDKSVTSMSKIGDHLENGPYRLIDPHYYKTIRVKGNYGVEVTITNVTEDDFGLYTCLVRNNLGKDYNSAFLSKYVKPRIPIKVTIPTVGRADTGTASAEHVEGFHEKRAPPRALMMGTAEQAESARKTHEE